MNDHSPDPLRDRLSALPRHVTPGRDLWPDIRAQLPPRARQARPLRFVLPLAAAAAIALAALALRPRPEPAGPGWNVASVSGTPRVGRSALTGTGQWHRGQWLETDAQSRAKLEVGRIGELRVEPNSRVRLVNTADEDHRIELARGTLSAFIWAPPRLFFVETPSATAIDLGCAYTLSVDDHGAGTLQVTSGYVALAHAGRESIIPAGLMCVTRPGTGPGTPFAAAAAPELRAALERFDFGPGGDAAIDGVLAAAGETDQVTLWHLLDRASAARRGAVFDRLSAFAPPPAEVTRAGIVAGDDTMRARWAFEVGLVPSSSKAKIPAPR